MSKLYFEKLNTEKLAELEKAELSKLEKVNLNAVSDATDAFDKVYDTIRKFRNETKDLDTSLRNFRTLLEELADFEYIVSRGMDELASVRSLAEKNLQNLEDGADALGLSVNDVPIYTELIKALDELEDFNDELVNNYQEITDIK